MGGKSVMAAKAKNRGLGRGLDALFADQAPVYNPVNDKAFNFFFICNTP